MYFGNSCGLHILNQKKITFLLSMFQLQSTVVNIELMQTTEGAWGSCEDIYTSHCSQHTHIHKHTYTQTLWSASDWLWLIKGSKNNKVQAAGWSAAPAQPMACIWTQLTHNVIHDSSFSLLHWPCTYPNKHWNLTIGPTFQMLCHLNLQTLHNTTLSDSGFNRTYSTWNLLCCRMTMKAV